jgi:hypothetical protein
MKIKKVGKRFIAYRDENDLNGSNGFSSNLKVGNALGSIEIYSEKFVGNTCCLVELKQHLQQFKENGYISKKQVLINQVLERIKQDVEDGDLTAINELLNFVPIKYLQGYL